MSDIKTITYTDEELAEIKDKIFASNTPIEVLENTYLYVFGVDLKDDNLAEDEVKAWEYHMADDLISEIIEFSFSLVEDEVRISVTMLWLNYGPSSKADLKINEVRREWENV